MKHTEMSVTIFLGKTPHCLGKQNVVFFYLFLLDITNSNILNKVMFRIIDMYAIIIISNIFINITSYLSIELRVWR